MAKGHSDHHQDQGTPTYIILSVLFAIVIFAFEGIKTTIALTGLDHQAQSTTLGYIGLGLCICFFWRRLHDSLFKALAAFFFTIGLWAYLAALIALPLLVNGEDAASRMQLVHQCGLGGVVITGFSLMAALLYHQKPVPALLMTTLAGFMVGYGSLYPLLRAGSVSIQHEMSIENRSSHGSRKVEIVEEPDEDHEEDDSEERLQRVLRREAADEKEHRTLSSAQKTKLERRDKPAHASSAHASASVYSHGKTDRKHKVSLAAKAPVAHGPHWEYSGAAGPEHWGELADSFKLCSTGLEQSPISIKDGWPTRDAIELDYKPSSFQVIDNGHTVQVNVERGNFANIAGQRYELKQFHFHSPSEHLVENRPYQMEVHFVHANDKGQLAVIGAFINPGKSHHDYQTVWDYIPVKANEPIKPYHVTLDLRRLLPTSLTAFNYAGSLTTPPCSEKVNWNVLHATLKLSQEQIDRFKLKYQMNARPAQPLNYRKP